MAVIGIAGTTSWGTTLAIISARMGLDVRLWARSEEEASRLRRDRENSRLLPGASFPAGLDVTPNADEAFGDADVVIVAVPSGTMRDNLRSFGDSVNATSAVVSATKGLEMTTGKRMSEVLEEELPPRMVGGICALSGPNLAGEIVQGKPSSTVVASRSEAAAGKVQEMLNSAHFRVYTNADIIGVELGGALKNIIALGAGICDGLEFGDNAKAAFITRGLTEITRLAVALGAESLTLAGLAGMGDLIATCSSPLSRNHSVGEALASGRKLAEIRKGMKHVAEGVDTTAAAVKMANKTGVDMPITQAAYDVLFDDADIHQVVSELMGRAPSPEWVGMGP